MDTHRKAFLHDFPASVAFLRRETRRNPYHLMPSTFSLCSKYFDEGSPTGISNALCQMMILEHTVDMQIFDADTLIALCVGLSRFEEKITALALDFEMGLGTVTRCLA